MTKAPFPIIRAILSLAAVMSPWLAWGVDPLLGFGVAIGSVGLLDVVFLAAWEFRPSQRGAKLGGETHE